MRRYKVYVGLGFNFAANEIVLQQTHEESINIKNL